MDSKISADVVCLFKDDILRTVNSDGQNLINPLATPQVLALVYSIDYDQQQTMGQFNIFENSFVLEFNVDLVLSRQSGNFQTPLAINTYLKISVNLTLLIKGHGWVTH